MFTENELISLVQRFVIIAFIFNKHLIGLLESCCGRESLLHTNLIMAVREGILCKVLSNAKFSYQLDKITLFAESVNELFTGLISEFALKAVN